MRPLATLIRLTPRLDYDGTQLRPHFIRSAFGLRGDAAVAFQGACDVRGTDLVDLADREKDAFIHSNDMLHVLVERFDPDLPRMILLQRLLAALVADRVRSLLPAARAIMVRRSGDDVFVGDGKLTVSIATVSPLSGLIHLGINVDDRDTPVTAAALGPLGLDPREFAKGLLADLVSEIDGVADAQSKVSSVGEGA